MEIAHTVQFCIWYDSTDASNKGWAYSYGYTDDNGGDHDSGPLPHRRLDCSLKTLKRALGRQLGADLKRALLKANFRRSETATQEYVAKVYL